MKTFKSFTFTLFLILFCFAGNKYSTAAEKTDGEKATVYYFHNTRRCATCIAIENETKKVLEESFAEEVDNGEILFKAFNAEDKANKELVKKMNVTGSALIIVRDNKAIDLTSKGFMYALKQPEKLRQAIWEILID